MPLTEKQIEALEEAAINIQRYSPEIRERYKAMGKEPDEAMLITMAKYWPAIQRLAKE